MFEKKKNEDLMKKAPAADAVELSDDVLEAAAGGARKLVYYDYRGDEYYRCGSCGGLVSRFCVVCPSCSSLLPPVRVHLGK